MEYKNAQEFWKQSLPQFEPCFLSHLAAPSAAATGRASVDCKIAGSTIQFFRQASTTSTIVTLQTAWAAVLGRYLASDSLSFVSTVTRSDSVQNNLCHVEWEGETTVGEAADRLEKWHASSSPYLNLSLSDLVPTTPICDTAVQVVFSSPSESDEAIAKYKVVASLLCNENNVKLVLQYAPQAISAAQMASIAGSLEKSLEIVISSPSQKFSGLDLCSDHDLNQLFSINAALPETVDSCLHILFEQRAILQPNATAAVGYGGPMTYRQLNLWAERLATVLRDMGVGPEVYVPFCFEKSTVTIVAMLAILKAGGACVALNPAHPINRLETILRKCDAKVVLTDDSHGTMFSGIVDHVVVMTSNSQYNKILTSETITSSISSKAVVTSRNPAFVVFTSGSTGEPKGIVLEHHALCTSMRNHGAAMRLDPQSRSLQFAAYTFDVSIGEIFTTLLYGGCVCVPSEEEKMNDLAGVIGRLNVNWAYLTPTVASLLNPSEVPTLKTLSLGGEAVKQENIQTWAEHVYLINIYGPAETTIWSTGLVNLKVDTPATNLGVGLGALMWVTSSEDPNKLCPVGAVGEILIEGPILARGYLKDKAKTDAAFIENPAWLPKGPKSRRLYRSADLGYLNPDGTLSFIGRRDNQVKMYGQRIEMGEIEFHLKQNFAALQSGAVEMIKPKVQNEQPVLAAFLCLKYSQGQNSGDEPMVPMTDDMRKSLLALKDSLTLHLPSYMVPSLFVPLVRMPTSVSGKLNRRHLRELGSEFSAEKISSYGLASITKEAPVTENEKFLQGMWVEALGMPGQSIGRQDSFFQLGGDSITAMKLVKAIRNEGKILTMSNIFRQPTLMNMAKVLDTSIEGEMKAEIQPFSLLNDKERILDHVTSTWGVARSEIEDIYPTTPLQEGLMAVTQRRPGTYIYQNVFDLPSDLDIQRYRKAWEIAVQTIQILRITIVPGDNMGAYQVVTNRGIEWQAPANVEEYLKADSEKSMQYGDPLARYAIMDRDGQAPVFVWTAHHVLYDGWSLPLLLKRVEELYKANGARLEASTVPFQDFIDHLQRADTVAAENFWKGQLSGISPPKFPHLPSVTYEPRVNEIHSHQFALSRLSASETTSSTLIRAAWALLMSQYSDAGDDIVFGITTAGRSADIPGITDMIAPTIATVPVRVPIDKERSVSQLLRQVQSQTVDMIPYEHIGLQNIAKINRECRMACGFQNLLVVQPEEDESLKSTIGIQQRSDPAVGIHTYALVVQAMLQGNFIKLLIDFDNNVLSSWQVERICYQLEHIICQLSSNVSTPIGKLNLCSDRDVSQLMDWNHDFPYVETRCIHQIIEIQARETPNAEAICSWDGSFTYKEVDQLSNRLARFLIQQGVGPEVLVPYCFHKSAWTAIVMLAIVKAGGACVALDPGHPVDRIETIISNANAKVVITTAELSHKFGSLVPHVVAFSPEFLNILKDDSPIPCRTTSNNPVFVLFTSGSTGKPKGIVIEHGMFATSAAAHSQAFGITSESRVFQFAAYTFDVSVGDIFTTLMKGGCICVPSDIERMNNIAGAINRMKVNYSFLTPTVANLLSPAEVPTLKRLTLGGEASTYENIRTWAEHIDLIICYGPAECSVYCSANPPATLQSNPAILGKAVGAHIWIVDPTDHNRLTPVGCVGELVVQGPTVARGYLNEPEKTRDAFVDDPVWLSKSIAGKYRRIYKTGDLARYNPDGTLSFVARKDTQVKVRGQRVELAEIEVHLSQSPEIKHALLSVPSSGSYKGRLVCVLSLQQLSPGKGDASEREVQLIGGSDEEKAAEMIATIQDRLVEKLPSYMIPAVWVVMRNIVLNLSGKMDRKHVKGWLEDVDEASYLSIAKLANAKIGSDRPISELEKKIQLAFSQTLNLPTDQIGLDTSFLILGGDSISAMQVMSRLRAQKIGVTVQDILRSRTVSALGKRAEIQETNSKDTVHDVEIIDKYFDLAPIQKRFFDMQPYGQNHFNQSFVLRLAKDVPMDQFKNALEAIVQRHSMLRSRYAHIDGHWRQKLTTDIACSLSVEPTQAFTNREDMLSQFSSVQKTLDITKGPIIAGQMGTASGTSYIFITVHHLVIDLVSWRIILEDLEDFLVSGSFKLQPTISFQTWSKLQSEYASSNMSAKDVTMLNSSQSNFEYWSMVGQSNTWGDIIESSFALDERRTTLLLGDAHKSLRTQPVDVMVSALIYSFQKVFTDRTAPSVFLEGHGREPWTPDIDISQTVGWFTTMFPVGADIDSQTLTWLDVVKRVKDNRQKIPNNGWSYFTAACLNPEASKAVDNLDIEILFNYSGLYQQLQRADALLQGTDISGTDLGDISPTMQRYSLFEITASVVERGRMNFSFEFNKNMSCQESIKSWIALCCQSLEAGIDQLISTAETATFADFPSLPLLSYSELEELTETILPAAGVHSLNQVETIIPCSPMQLSLLLAQLKTSGDYEFYTIIEATSKAAESINTQLLLKSWQEVVDRHSALRTIFIQSAVSGKSYDQLVLKEISARVSEIYSDEPIEDLRKRQPVTAFDGKVAHQLTICHTSTGSVFFKLEVNHALIDGTSMAIILRDLKRAYSGKLLDHHPALAYSDYVSYLQEAKTQESVDFWKNHLEDIQPCHFPILDDGRDQDAVLESVDVELPDLTRDRLAAFSDRYGLTVANVIQTAWALVLRAFTGTDSVCYGYLTSGRDAPLRGIEDSVGPYIHMLVCRQNFDASSPALKALQIMQDEFLQGMSHQYVSLNELQNVLGLSGQKLFNTAMSFQRYPAAENSELALDAVYDFDPTEFDITVNVAITEDDGLKVDLTHWTSKVTSANALNIAHTFAAAISSLFKNPETLISEVDLLSIRDKKQLQQWTAEVPVAVERCMHDVVSQRARERPTAHALESWEATYTYEQLDKVTARLSRHFAAFGIKPDDCIPLCFEKSLYTIVAMIAVLKAGGAFVLLDPKFPNDRLRGILEDINARFIIASPQTENRCKELLETVVVVAPDMISSLPANDTPIVTAVQPRNIMYVQFTSGSTGKPKGAVVDHLAACSSIKYHGKAMRYGPDARVYQFSSYTFDAIILEAFTTLYHGGCVCVPSEEDRMSRMAASMRELNVNLMFMTPTLARLFKPEDVPSLVTLMLGGEPIPQDCMETWADRVNLIGGYGPAECCVYCCYNPLSETKLRPDVIGFPVGSVPWVVDTDDHNKLVPVGAVGELLVHGPIVGRCYLGDKVKTQASFISSPSWMTNYYQEEQRLYKTGDLVRFNSDGTLTIIGRKDTQVKLNGQRIELGEIEYHIKSKFPKVLQVAVDALQPASDQGRQILSAFLDFGVSEVSKTAHSSSDMLLPISDSLRDHMLEIEHVLSHLVPPYMVPRLWFPLRSMPKSASGKTDRKALKEHCNALTTDQLKAYGLAGGSQQALSTEVEKIVHGLWKKILHTEQLDANDNFFRVGGDSIAAMNLATEAQRQGLSLTVSSIFMNPRLSDMAKAIEAASQTPIAVPYAGPFSLVRGSENGQRIAADFVPSLSAEVVEDVYPATPLQEGLIILTINDPSSYVHRAVFRLPRDIDQDRFREAWANVFEQNAILRTTLVPSETFGTCQVVVRRKIEWATSPSLDTYLANDTQIPITWGSLLTRYGTTEDGHFIWTAHHSIYDGWSFSIMMEQVSKSYLNQPIRQGPSFQEFIQYLQKNEDTQVSVDFWKTKFEGAAPVVFPQLPNPTYKKHVSKSHRLTMTNIDLPGNADITMSTVLSGAWGLTIGQSTNISDVVFGTTRSGRNVDVPGVVDIMGPTITTIPVRMVLDPSISVHQFLTKVQIQATETIPHEHLGLQNIRKINNYCKAACEFENLFVVQTPFATEGSLGLEEIEIHESGLHTYGLNVECHILKDNSVSVNFEYDSSLIPTFNVERLAGHFQHAVRQLSNLSESTALGEIETFSPEDRKMMQRWNATPYPAVNKTVDGIIRAQADLRPSSTALTQSDGISYTYAQLDKASTVLAQELSDLGVTEGHVIPICLRKSALVVISMLAIAKCGAAFICFEPSMPADRMEFIIKEITAPIVITDYQTCNMFQGESATVHTTASPVIITKSLIERLITTTYVTMKPKSTPHELAYLIFTSGSTGKPKGVMIEHASFCSSMTYQSKFYGFNENTRTLQFCSLTFDASLMEIFSTLCVGGCVCFPSEEERNGDWVTAANELQINAAMLTPTVLRTTRPEDIPSLKVLITGGEAVGQDIVRAWSNSVKLINVYGPTETTMVCIMTTMDANSSPARIGYPVGCKSWVTIPDDHNRLAPLGSIGELVIQGPYVSRGYYKEPEKTAEVFIDTPSWLSQQFSQTGRVYKTGDLVYYAEDGSIVIVGRKDNQIKIRGLRVELGEIEHNLQAHTDVVQASVVFPKVGLSKDKLVAVMTLHGVEDRVSGSADLQLLTGDVKKYADSRIQAIRKSLEERLPLYMVPSIFVAVSKMPRQISSKTDTRTVKKWIEEMDEHTYFTLLDIGASSGPVEPTNEVEEQIQKTFARLLSLQPNQVMLNRSFISLGGDSISAMKAMASLKDAGISLTIKEILRSESITDLANIASSQKPSLPTDSEIGLWTDLSTSQSELINETSDNDDDGVVSETLQSLTDSILVSMKTGVTESGVRDAIHNVATLHSALRARFKLGAEGHWMTTISSSIESSYICDVTKNCKKSDVDSITKSTTKRLDIIAGPVFGAHLLLPQQGEPLLFLVAHRLVSDAAPWSIILKDLGVVNYPLLAMTYDEHEMLLHNRLPEIGISTPSEVEDIYPCSPLQEGLLLAQTKGTGSYHTSHIQEITSSSHINVQIVISAWKKMVSRHQILRTIFIQGVNHRATFVQLVLRSITVDPIVLETNGLDAIEKLQNEPQATDFGALEPWHRLLICQDKSGKTFCRLDIHHALFDGTALNILFQDLASTYGKGEIPITQSLFSDYVAYLLARPPDSALAYWKDFLSGLEPCNFPSMNTEIESPRETKSLEFDVRNFASIQSLSSKRNVTISTILQTAWALVLRQYTGSDDVSFGFLSNGRDIPLNNVNSLVGPLINMLVCRMKLGSDSYLKDILDSTQDNFLNSLSYQHTSLAEIYHALNLNGRSLFNTSLSFVNELSEEHDGLNSAINFISVGGKGSTEYDIAINASVSGGVMQVAFTYRSSSLSTEQANHLAEAFIKSIDILVDTPEDVPLNQVDFTSDLTYSQLRAWNSKPLKPVYECVHDLFKRASRTYPHNTAICSSEGDFTYKQLDDLTTRFSQLLKERGVGPEILVPVCFKKSAWTIVSMISILKAGGACVPLDPSHPDSRIQEIINNCKSNLLISAPQFASRLAPLVKSVIQVDHTFIKSLASVNRRDTRSNVSPLNPAFIVFTSGSTGKPKGIVLEHKGLCTMFLANASVVGIGPKTRTFQYAAYTFDVSIAETYITLTHGGCVCVPTEEERMNDITGSINRLRANWTFLTPSVASLLHPDLVPTLKTLTLGGEAIARDLHSRWASRVRLINSYGPAECSIWTSNNQLSAHSSCSDIGDGTNCLLWVTEPDDHNRLVPIGCVGELVVQGPNLARGYLNDKEKTDAAYIRTPSWLREWGGAEETKRLYKTGDLVRQRPDGGLEFAGRKDTQVKFHGQRIEIGEVEYQLRAHLPTNTEVAMEMIKPLSQNSRQTLAAFICLGDGESKTTTLPGDSDFLTAPTEAFKVIVKDLEASLLESLPAYMVPSLFINVMSIPKNTSMKIDRKALRAKGQTLSLEEISSYSFVSGNKVAPQTSTQKKLHKLWVQVLKVSEIAIGIEDSFFRVGGDSVAAMQLVTAARNAGISLTVMEIFQNPTIKEMAVVAREQDSDLELELKVAPFSLLQSSEVDSFVNSSSKKVGLSSELVQDIYPTTPLQEGLMSLTMQQHGLYTLQALYALPSDIDIARFQSAWDQVVEELDILRTCLVDYENRGAYQVVLPPDACRIQWNSGDNVQVYLKKDRELTFDYGKQLTRYAIVKEDSRAYFIWTAHHAVYDGWSLALMLDVLERKYKQENSLPTPSFNIFIKWMVETDETATRNFWKSNFVDINALTFPSVPVGYRPKATGVKTHSITLPTKPDTAITLPTIIRSAWALNIARYTGSDDVVFGMTQSGRNAPVPGISNIVAPLITTIPVRVTFDKQQSISTLLENIQNNSISMIPYEHAGLQNISRYSLECQTACKFQNLLVIQSQQESAPIPLGMERIPISDLEIPAFGIVVECEVVDGEVIVNAGYDPRVVSAAQMDNIMAQFDHLTKILCQQAASTTTLNDLPLLGQNDQLQLEAWNSPHEDRIDRCAQDMIRERALIQPDALAIDAADGRLTYKQLDDLSTRLAHFLVDIGIESDVIVPLFFRKSAWAIVSMLAVIKSGGGFVFLDPQHPVDRLEYIMKSIKGRFVITTPELKKSWPLNLPVLTVSASFFSSRPSHPEPPIVNATPRSILYVIFTSGSTGRPKGCIIEHSSFLTGALHHAKRGKLSPSSRILQIAPYTFDVSILETLTGLISGACICLPRAKHQGAPIAEVISDLGITWSFLTPSVARTVSPDDVPTLETLVLGGEALSKIDIETWAPKVRLCNGYGPSECSIAVAANTNITRETDAANIGTKMGCNLWVVASDDHDVLLPIGAVGELLVEGAIVSRGYLNEPEKTAAVFIENPAWTASQLSYNRDRRFYKTGDLVYFEEDGSVHFIGRKDTQVKLRGQRIEIGEIEHHASVHPDVKHAMVALPRSGRFKESLVALFSLKEVSNINNSNDGDLCPLTGASLEDVFKTLPSMRTSLMQRLPPYMVPSTFIAIEELPLLPSGKINRTRITKWLETMDNETHEAIAAQSGCLASHAANPIKKSNAVALRLSEKVTQLLAGNDEAYAETIRGRNIGLVQAGMNSISVVSLASFIKEEYGVKLPMEMFMDSSITVEDIALKVENFGSQVDKKNLNLLEEVDLAMEELEKEVGGELQTKALKVSLPKNYRSRVLLTGATGFLGSVLLRQLLEDPNISSVVALVRARDQQHAMQRIVSSATMAKWWQPEIHASRLEVWVGDLAKPQLGLGESELQQLKGQVSQRIDAVIHNGATVHWVADYASLKSANVSSVVSLLASLVQSPTVPPPRFTFVSGGHVAIGEETELDAAQLAEFISQGTGYAQSKFVADEVVKRFAQKYPSISATIVKPGLIIGTAESGVSNADDFFWRVVATAIDTQSYNGDEQDATILLAGAQQVASSVITTTFSDEKLPVENNVSHGITTKELWTMLSKEFGYKMQPMGASDWLKKMTTAVHDKGDQHRLWPVLHFLEATEGYLGRVLPEELRKSFGHHQNDEVKASLRSSINYMRGIGYFAMDSSTADSISRTKESGFSRGIKKTPSGVPTVYSQA
ncbi:putative nonribosomal peptide synthase [Talaromyces proteolyticus]|uniref:Nonribosomal peptide synthase n=1 Tax=Talaromyces proteolyticus TaxID=1131652 RepID=A0AAD4PTU7_9EURO|nr:putative nonribosomal peptide synthase [Talaromyces proteolyticus]KAH8693923.1 putative nonribosomal peptide synthase [Talaromyces proteolyticus]